MIRLITASVLFLIVLIIDTSFIASLPNHLSYIPFLFACSVYLIQHTGSRVGIWWLIAFGFFLDIFRIGSAPFETVIYAVSAGVMYYLSWQLFSNRSLYGILGCSLVGIMMINFFHAAYMFWLQFSKDAVFSWNTFVGAMLWQLLFLLIVISILFLFARRVRGALTQLLIIPHIGASNIKR